MTAELILARDAVVDAREETERILASLGLVEVGSDDDADSALEIVREVRSSRVALEEKRKSLTAPLKKVARDIEEMFRAPIAAYDEIERALKLRVLEYRERATLAARALLANPTEASIAEFAATVPAPTMDGAHVVEKWTGDVVDASAIPREYLVPDVDALVRATREAKGAVKIPGWTPRLDRALTVRR